MILAIKRPNSAKFNIVSSPGRDAKKIFKMGWDAIKGEVVIKRGRMGNS